MSNPISTEESNTMTPHNPDKLTDTQIGTDDGWRLLDEDEASFITSLREKEIERWASRGVWWNNSLGTDFKITTYRTKLTRAELRKKRRLPPETDTHFHNASAELSSRLADTQHAMLELSSRLATAEAERDALIVKWESDQPGKPGRMYRGLCDLIADLTGSHYSSRPSSCYVEDLAKQRDSAVAQTQRLTEEVERLRKTLKIVVANIDNNMARGQLLETIRDALTPQPQRKEGESPVDDKPPEPIAYSQTVCAVCNEVHRFSDLVGTCPACRSNAKESSALRQQLAEAKRAADLIGSFCDKQRVNTANEIHDVMKISSEWMDKYFIFEKERDTALARVAELEKALKIAIDCLHDYSSESQSGKMTHFWARDNLRRIAAMRPTQEQP